MNGLPLKRLKPIDCGFKQLFSKLGAGLETNSGQFFFYLLSCVSISYVPFDFEAKIYLTYQGGILNYLPTKNDKCVHQILNKLCQM